MNSDQINPDTQKTSLKQKQHQTVQLLTNNNKCNEQRFPGLTSSSFPLRDRMKILMSSEILSSLRSMSLSFCPDGDMA